MQREFGPSAHYFHATVPNSASAVKPRFYRKRTTHYRVWAPPESPVGIEYSMELLREAARHQRGVLYGVREGATVRVVAARRDQSGQDGRLSKLELLGTFAFRARGEIFLTEPDLGHLERTGGSLALVVAGTNAGFFVYEADGSIQTIQSYREFCIFDPIPEAQPAPAPDRRKLWISLACLATLSVPVIAHAFPRTHPFEVSVREDAGQLKISWTPNAFPSARLEISDGAERTWTPVPGTLSGVTYVPRTTDVNIRLIAGARTASAHFIGVDAVPPEVEQIKQLKSEADALRTELDTGHQREVALQADVARVLAALQ